MRQKSFVSRILALVAWIIVTMIVLVFLLRWRGNSNAQKSKDSE